MAKRLKFDTLAELQEFFIKNDLSVCDYTLHENEQILSCEIEQTPESEVEVIPECASIVLKSFAGSPILEAKVGDENIIYVDECEIVKNACMTTRLKFLESYVWANLCDCDGKTTISLDVAITEDTLYNVPFVVKEKQADSPAIEIKKDMLCKLNHHSS